MFLTRSRSIGGDASGAQSLIQQHDGFETEAKVTAEHQWKDLCIHVWSVECRGFEFHPRQLFFLRKCDYLGCAVLLCLVVCLTLLASFFLPSHLH